MRVMLPSLSRTGHRVVRVMLPSLSAWYWTKDGQGHAVVSISLVLDMVNEGHAAVSISLVWNMRWTGSCCSLYQPGIGQKMDRVMLSSLSAWYWT